jgi:hypothetical protein
MYCITHVTPYKQIGTLRRIGRTNPLMYDIASHWSCTAHHGNIAIIDDETRHMHAKGTNRVLVDDALVDSVLGRLRSRKTIYALCTLCFRALPFPHHA